MKYFLMLLLLSLADKSNMEEIYKFSIHTKLQEWRIVNDGVMGGISQSSLQLSDAGHGCFTGQVSLADNGGFASIQSNTNIKIPADKKFIVLRLKGDGKNYEFRLKGRLAQSESYVHQFSTTGEWETIRLEISKFYPQFRGRKLSTPNFNFQQIEQISFLIANKREEDFKLLIDFIALD